MPKYHCFAVHNQTLKILKMSAKLSGAQIIWSASVSAVKFFERTKALTSYVISKYALE